MLNEIQSVRVALVIQSCRGVKRANIPTYPVTGKKRRKEKRSLFCPSLPQLIQGIFKKMSHAFLIFPQFNFGNGMLQLARMNIEVQILSGYGIDAYHNPFSKEALGWMFISSFIQGLVFFTLRLLLNKFLIRKVR